MTRADSRFQLSDSFKSNLKLKLSGISGAFMLPIATMAITSFFLSVGGAIHSSSSHTGNAFQAIALPILQAFPLLICISFALAFTKDNHGIAVWCAILSFLTFIYLQSAFIECNGTEACKCTCTGKKNSCCQDGKCSCLLPCCLKNYTVFFFHKNGGTTSNAVQKLFGVTTLNGSIFPSIIIGGIIIPFLFRRYSEIKLPTYLSYFAGKRFLPLLSCIAVIPLAFLFLVFWPWINYGLGQAGNHIAKSKGADAFIFGFLEKALIPTGFHHMFASLFWYTPLGGDIYLADNFKQLCCNGEKANNCCLSSTNIANSLQWQGDALIGMSALSLPNWKFTNGNGSQQVPHIARFTQGKFPIMQFALPAAALAIYLASKKERRREKGKTLFPGIWNSIILGITEPIEFSFMYKLPKLFYLFHTTMCGVSFLTMQLLDAHIPTAFSGGIIELIVNGVISVNKGNHFYWWAVVGSGLAVVYFLVFYLSFRWNNRQEEREEEHIHQDSEVESQDEEIVEIGEQQDGLPPQVAAFKRGLGGWENVTNYKNCASRLRYDIQDKSKIVESELKKAGVIAIKWVSENHVQLIVGPKAEEINSTLLKYKAEESEKKA